MADQPYLVLRIIHDARSFPPKHRAFGPTTKAEAAELVEASARVLKGAGYHIRQTEDRVTAWANGSPLTTTVMMVDLSPATDQILDVKK